MSNTIAETFNWMTGVLCVAVLMSISMPALERPLLYLLVIGSSLAHWHYGSVVVSLLAKCSRFQIEYDHHANFFPFKVQQMCEHFNRICFKVTKPKEIKQ